MNRTLLIKNTGYMSRGKLKNAIAFALFILSATSAAIAVAAPLGTRAGLWTFRTGFDILDFGASIGIIIAFAALVYGAGVLYFGRKSRGGEFDQARPGRPILWAALAVVIGAATFTYPFGWLHVHQSVPPIHDITTDIEDPPAFVTALKLRPEGSNTTVHGGEPVAVMQTVAYPGVKPILTDAPPGSAFERALGVARDLGWEITATAPEEGRIEALETTFWFGFTDDIVIRVRGYGKGSRVDVRSVSRVGKNDAGTNARRVERFIRAYND